jgi:ABC-type glycerol-3-phosphate transport system permease component
MQSPTRAVKKRPQWLAHLTLGVLAALSLLPFALLIVLSFKSTAQFDHERWSFSWPLHPENYAAAWSTINTYILNSVIVSAGAAVGVVALSALAGFALARGRFRGRNTVFLLIISGLMIPGVLYLVPKFVLFSDFGLINTRWALWLAYWTEGQIFGIFLFRSYFESLPEGLFEAARVDGAGPFAQFRYIGLPMSKPIAGTLAVINVMFTWNDIVWQWLAISDDAQRTLAVGMFFFQQGHYNNWGPMFAGFVIASIPLILLFALTSRWFIEGLTSGAFKA